MFPYDWQPGEKITAAKLKGGLLTGTVSIELTTTIDTDDTGQIFAEDYLRGTADVVFPSGTFTVTPRIFVTGRSSTPGTLIECTYTSQSEDGFTISIARSTSTTTTVDWLAMDAQ